MTIANTLNNPNETSLLSAMVAQEPVTKYGTGILFMNRYFLKSQAHHRPLSLNT